MYVSLYKYTYIYVHTRIFVHMCMYVSIYICINLVGRAGGMSCLRGSTQKNPEKNRKHLEKHRKTPEELYEINLIYNI